MKITEILNGRGEICEEILRSLPEWFGTESAIQEYVSEVEAFPTFLAEEEDRAVGFLSLNLHNEFTAEIHIMGVLKPYHRRGLGRALILHAESYLKSLGFEYLSVKVAQPATRTKEFELTRKFYVSLCFRPVEEFKNLSGEGEPCLFMIKSLK